jgi:hypothetical protein
LQGPGYAAHSGATIGVAKARSGTTPAGARRDAATWLKSQRLTNETAGAFSRRFVRKGQENTKKAENDAKNAVQKS